MQHIFEHILTYNSTIYSQTVHSPLRARSFADFLPGRCG
jgi:hypothetical protein